MIQKGDVLHRIDALMSQKVVDQQMSNLTAGNVYLGALGVASLLYGAGSLQVEAIKEAKKRIMAIKAVENLKNNALVQELHGMLQCMKDECNNNLFTSIAAEAKGEILADFLVLAKGALESDAKDVAAVLACASLEDTLKRYAELNALDVDDKSLDEVVAALRAAGLVRGPQGKLLQSFVPIRNKAFHAQWDKIDRPEVQSVVAFVEEFLLTKFSLSPDAE